MTRMFERIDGSALRLFALLQVLDVATTLYGLTIGAVEKNGFMQALVGNHGPLSGLVLGKLMTLSLLLAFVMYRPKAIRVCNWSFALVVLWNVGILALQHHLYLR